LPSTNKPSIGDEHAVEVADLLDVAASQDLQAEDRQTDDGEAPGGPQDPGHPRDLLDLRHAGELVRAAAPPCDPLQERADEVLGAVAVGEHGSPQHVDRAPRPDPDRAGRGRQMGDVGPA
jgi:hypothetical protein